ncbi:E3 ubiquitin-protein ligase RNF114 [Protopterus annectens]|uniref:E3 ubiquitin-protein ligase RNF114 n=1 Tax=Protopterus annectens TaxID=7888 RepID=UPI001CFBB455|nr:E3 ubiquitin-protein ligase RNF114 [Protopterus annectens]
MAMTVGKEESETSETLSSFLCPVCLEVFDNPIRVKCGHVFCSICLHQCLKPNKPVCGVCRSPLIPSKRAVDVERLIETTETKCRGCEMKLYLSKMRAHVASCLKYQNYIMEGVQAATKEQRSDTRNVPNRFTFTCPYCSEKNLDQEALVEHCCKYHSMDARQVVCPVCVSMPWGDPSYASANFIQHLQRRHKFSYDTFVDYEADEEVMIQEALARSLTDH